MQKEGIAARKTIGEGVTAPGRVHRLSCGKKRKRRKIERKDRGKGEEGDGEGDSGKGKI